MTNRWGKVFQNSRGAWCVRGTYQGERCHFSKYHSDLGPRTCQTKEEAERLQTIISSQIAAGHFNVWRYKRTKPLHLRKYSLAWLKKIEPTVQFATYKTYRAAIKNHLIPVLGNTFLPDVNYDHFLKLWTEIKKSPKYRKNIISTLYTILEDARRAGHIDSMPDRIIFKGKFTVPQHDPAWISKDTQALILDKIRPEDRPLFQFLFITGVRPSEARALQKTDLHKEQGYISIRYTFAPTGVKGQGEQLKEVKQKRERRIPFYDALVPILETMIGNLTAFVFVNPRTGRPYTKDINRRIWNPACKKAGVKIQLNNAGRHSFGNQLSDAGIDLETIAKGLGHSSTQTTKNFYANPAMNVLKKAVDNLRRLPVVATKKL